MTDPARGLVKPPGLGGSPQPPDATATAIVKTATALGTVEAMATVTNEETRMTAAAATVTIIGDATGTMGTIATATAINTTTAAVPGIAIWTAMSRTTLEGGEMTADGTNGWPPGVNGKDANESGTETGTVSKTETGSALLLVTIVMPETAVGAVTDEWVETMQKIEMTGEIVIKTVRLSPPGWRRISPQRLEEVS